VRSRETRSILSVIDFCSEAHHGYCNLTTIRNHLQGLELDLGGLLIYQEFLSWEEIATSELAVIRFAGL
jgi:hypothetical protein